MIVGLGWAVQIVAAALAWRAARVRPAHRPVAHYLAIIAVTDPLRAVLAWLVLHPARAALGAGVPYHGLARAVFHLDQAGFLVGPVGLAIVSPLVFFGLNAPRIGHLLGLSALLWVALVVSYPSDPGAYYDAWRGMWWPGVIVGTEALSVIVAAASAGWWMRRNPGGWADETSKVVMALAAADLALWLAGVLPSDPFGRWHLGDAARAAILCWICWAQLAWIRSTGAAVLG